MDITQFDFDGHKFFPLYDPALSLDRVTITDEESNLFHTTERKLFYRIVRKLGRNTDESMRAVAFLLWLERIGYSHHAVHKVTAWPFHLVVKLANEIAGFLRCLEKETIGGEYIRMYSIRKLCSRHIKLLEFHDKRVKILESVAKIVSEVCVRAFKDIVTGDGEFVDVEGDGMWLAYINPAAVGRPRFNQNVAGGFRQLGFRGNSGSGKFDGSHR